ncbi:MULTISPECIES: M48 family metallopeptidase [unclassified Campylobacter]|uniref:M48 family metallopeptidase n=1 Tax=unclassified Campylobacter TaxID=2593542 RepID=UPI001237BE7B|nr:MULTISPECIES: M48 family metallopeptidase [unclassified Campylobacter]KAA6226330.1 M48 family metallopeptidase [Campylobacter sp. LR286c]KAA6226822.1 M48 family metallopeptidase [Campylobacter sp. LR196d]KAA6230259.1 M48 family metallopeptidase [Campylobacter sp. LR291e]
MILITILCVYTLVYLSIDFIQLNFLKKERDKKAEILSQNDYINAANISIENTKFNIFSNLYTLFLNILWLSFGFLYLKEFLIQENSRLENTLFLLIYLIILSLLTLPLSIYEQFVKNKKQGFSNIGTKLFIVDNIKSLILLIIFGFLIIYGLLFCYDFFASFWWLAAFIFAFCIILCVQIIYPLIIVPMFNKMQKLDDENLLNEISSLMKRCGFNSNGVFVIDASKRDKRLNAYFGGLFKSKRVVLFDTLLNALNQRELIAVLGHELGHFVHKDLIKLLTSSALMLFVLFFIFAHLPNFVYEESNLNEVNAGVFVLLIIFGPVFVFFISPLINFLSRKNEFKADEHGALMTSKEDMKNALIALAKENKAFVKTSKIYTFFHLTHPSISDRLRALN